MLRAMFDIRDISGRLVSAGWVQLSRKLGVGGVKFGVLKSFLVFHNIF
jgi:hypothetical protein